VSTPRSLRSGAGWLLGCALWVAALWVVADPWEGRRGQSLAVATLASTEDASRAETLVVSDGAPEQWVRFHCTLVDTSGGSLETPHSVRLGWQVLARRVRCEEGGSPFWVAWHRLGVQPSSERRDARQIAAATIPGPLVVKLLEEEVPRHANRALRAMMVTYGEELRLHSRRWRVPSFLLDQVRLSEDSSVVLSAVRAGLGENTLELEAQVDVTLNFVFEARRVIGSSRRPPRRFHVRMTEQLSPMRLVLRVTDTNAVRVEDLSLRRRGCQVSEVPFLSQLFSLNDLCDDVLSTLQQRVEVELKEAIGARVGDVIQKVELGPLLAQLVDPWIRGAVLGEAFEHWWEELALGLQSLRLSPTQISLTLEGAGAWADGMPPWPKLESVDAEQGRVLVSSVALMSLAQALFERPADELLAMAEAFDEPAVAEQLARLQQTVEASGLMREEAVEAGESLDTALALLGLEVVENAVVRPRFWVEDRHALGAGVEELRALSVRGGDAGLSFTGWATVRWGTSLEEGLALTLWSHDAGALQVALNLYASGELKTREAARLGAQLRLMRDGISRVAPRPALQVPLPKLKGLTLAGTSVEVREVWGDVESQVFGLELAFDSSPTRARD